MTREMTKYEQILWRLRNAEAEINAASALIYLLKGEAEG